MEHRATHKGRSVATVRMSEELHEAIRDEAHRLRVSQNELMVSRLEPLLLGRGEGAVGNRHAND